MSEFIEECRLEWRRLGVPDPVANEMAADLAADLEEAQAEGGSPEDVLGNSAFDPRRFAAAWANARGVTGRPITDHRSFWRPPVAIAVTVLLSALTVGAGLIVLFGLDGGSFAFASHRIVVHAGPLRLFPPAASRLVIPRPLGPFVGTPIGGVGVQPIALALLIVGVVGLGLLAVLCWSPWYGRRRYQRPGRTPSWN